MSLSYQQMKIAVSLVIKAGNVPSIVGEAGIGKSALVQEIAASMGAKLYTTVVSLSEKGDLAIPVPPLTERSFVTTQHYGTLANVQFGYSETLVAIVKQAEAHSDQPIIWFLDEFNRGTQAVQSELMNLVLQRQVNSLKLPDQVHIVIAENPDSTMENFADSDYGVTAGDAAIRDRTVRLVMKAAVDDWLLWARQLQSDGQPRIHELVAKYIRLHPNLLAPADHEKDLYPTPRAWARVSGNLRQLEQLDEETQTTLAADLFSGDLGSEVGAAFAKFVAQHGQQLSVADLIDHSTQLQFVAEVDRLTAVRQWVKELTKYPITQYPAQFKNCLYALSPDGRFAVVQDLGEQAVAAEQIKALYQAANENPGGDQEQLYRLLERITVEAGD